jgi:hypothetical protein
MGEGLAHLAKSCGDKGLHPKHCGATAVVVFSRGRQLMGIQLIEDLQLLPERCWRKDIRFGGISSATPHPDLLKTLTGRERDVPMMGLVFEGTVGIDPGI